jgi:2-(1,2-epoxy-1,2-dihydrophenyl)acetyl-CoA isomerase
MGALDGRSVLVTGAGRAFSAGGDMDDDSFISTGWEHAFGPAREISYTLHQSDKISVAAINGPVAGGALGVVMAADFRLASEKAHFSSAFVQIGLAPEMGLAYFLTRQVGYARAIEFLIHAKRMPASRALELGIVHEVLAHEEFEADALAYAKALAAMAPLSLQATKRLARMALESGPLDVMLAEAHAAVRLGATADHKEGVGSFMQRRPPRFEGR